MKITCIDDRLTFHFPEHQTALAACATTYVEGRLRNLETGEVWANLLCRWRARHDDHGAKLLTKGLDAMGFGMFSGADELVRAAVATQLSECSPVATIACQRTLRIPDEGRSYPLPPGLGQFPLRVIERHADTVPATWLQVGGVLMPMYQAEALWISLDSTDYPFAVKIGTGLINAVSGDDWGPGLSREPQGYVVLPEQPWIDGFNVGKGVVRQFVATRLGQGYTAEEQVRGTALGGIQVEVVPIRPQAYFDKHLRETMRWKFDDLVDVVLDDLEVWMAERGVSLGGGGAAFSRELCTTVLNDMGIGAGGRIRQSIYRDPWEAADWDLTGANRAWIHLCDAVRWREITGELPPHQPVTANEYTAHGFPWFDYYLDDLEVLAGTRVLEGLQSVFTLGGSRGDASIPQEAPVTPGPVLALGPDAPQLSGTG